MSPKNAYGQLIYPATALELLAKSPAVNNPTDLLLVKTYIEDIDNHKTPRPNSRSIILGPRDELIAGRHILMAIACIGKSVEVDVIRQNEGSIDAASSDSATINTADEPSVDDETPVEEEIDLITEGAVIINVSGDFILNIG